MQKVRILQKGITKDHRGDCKVSCACHNQLCDRCGNKVYEFPIGSTIFNEERGLVHVPVLCAWGHKCPDGVNGQLKHSSLIDPRTGEDLLHPGKQTQIGKMLTKALKRKERRGE